MMKRTALMLGLAILAWTPAQAGPAGKVPAAIAAAVASSDRPKADTDRDVHRHPGELLAWAGVHPGERVADLVPGGGYFTRLFSKTVGPRGHVYGVVPAELLAVAKKANDGMKAIIGAPGYGNVTGLVLKTAEISAPEPIDVAWTSQNYHDVYGFFGADAAAAFDAAVFRMLKPGGLFIVIDHVATAGTSDTSPKKLHRIDPATVKAQVTAAGFQFVGSSDMLRNKDDAHTESVFSPTIRGETDQFVMKFRKPLR